MKTGSVQILTRSIIGLIFLIPPSYFMLTLLVRLIFGSTTLYYAIAPSFLQASTELFSYHKSGWILYGPLFAVILNLPAIFKFNLQRNASKLQLKFFYRSYWLNTAVIFQGLLLFIIVVIYLVIQHYRF
jgi:hypothetical protein